MNVAYLINRLWDMDPSTELNYVVWDGSVSSFVQFNVNSVTEEGFLLGTDPQTVVTIEPNASGGRDWTPEPAAEVVE